MHKDSELARIRCRQCILVFSYVFIAISTFISFYLVSEMGVRDGWAWLAITAMLWVPNGVMAIWLKVLNRRKNKSFIPWSIAILIAIIIEPIMLFDAVYIHPDPQSPIVIMLIPVLQILILVGAVPIMMWFEY